MIEDDAPPARPDGEFPRALDRMSIDALEAYTAALEAEIARVRGEIARKRRLQQAADSVFKPPS